METKKIKIIFCKSSSSQSLENFHVRVIFTFRQLNKLPSRLWRGESWMEKSCSKALEMQYAWNFMKAFCKRNAQNSGEQQIQSSSPQSDLIFYENFITKWVFNKTCWTEITVERITKHRWKLEAFPKVNREAQQEHWGCALSLVLSCCAVRANRLIHIEIWGEQGKNFWSTKP